MVGIHAHFFQIVVFSGNAKALLRIRNSGNRGGLIAKKIILELVHARIREEEGRIVFYNQGGRGNNLVPFLFKEVKISLTNFGYGHNAVR